MTHLRVHSRDSGRLEGRVLPSVEEASVASVEIRGVGRRGHAVCKDTALHSNFRIRWTGRGYSATGETCEDRKKRVGRIVWSYQIRECRVASEDVRGK
jgi:hypothetical protein